MEKIEVISPPSYKSSWRHSAADECWVEFTFVQDAKVYIFRSLRNFETFYRLVPFSLFQHPPLFSSLKSQFFHLAAGLDHCLNSKFSSTHFFLSLFHLSWQIRVWPKLISYTLKFNFTFRLILYCISRYHFHVVLCTLFVLRALFHATFFQ